MGADGLSLSAFEHSKSFFAELSASYEGSIQPLTRYPDPPWQKR